MEINEQETDISRATHSTFASQSPNFDSKEEHTNLGRSNIGLNDKSDVASKLCRSTSYPKNVFGLVGETTMAFD